MSRAAALLCSVACISGARAVELKPETVQAFNQYIHGAEARLDKRLAPGAHFLWVDDDGPRLTQVRGGQLAIESLTGKGAREIPGGLIHDWIGAIFIPGVTLEKTLALIQDYNHHQFYYKPEVMVSRLISRHGNDFKVYLRLMKHKFITVILDTYYDVHYFPLSGGRCYSRAYSTRIVEVEDAGKPDEHDLPPGNDSGYLWRLDSYWSFEQRDGGVYVECEAISLTRGIPAGLGWLIEPVVNNLPRESLANTLLKLRVALRK